MQGSVTAAALIIGDEILSGRTQDVNIGAIAKFVAVHGVELAEVRVVSDEIGRIVEAVDALRAAYRYVFTTGGIGPTHDDITADAVAQAFGLELYEHPEILAGLQSQVFTQDPDYRITDARRRMARVPRGATLIKNAMRGPPGFQIGNVFVLAGVPAVMRSMLEDVGHRLEGGAVVVSRTLRVEGVAEGVIAAPLEAVAKANPHLSLGSYPYFFSTSYGANLVVRGGDAGEVESAVEALKRALRDAGVDSFVEVEA